MKKSTPLRIAVLILGCSVLAALFIMGIISNLGQLMTRSTPFPLDMHSSIQADYQKDPDYMRIPPMNIQLVIDTIWDLNLNSQDLSTRLTQVNDNFLASVATVTPRPSPTDIIHGQPTATFSDDGPPENVDLTPPSTNTITPVGFIASPTVAIPTFTPQSPTVTANLPTNTVPPPTNTVSPCGQLSIINFSLGNKKVSWSVVNNSSSSLPLNSIKLVWPSSNGDLSKVFFAGSKLWESSASPPSITINSSGVLLSGNSSKKLEFFFLSDAVPSGYSLNLNINGCQITKSN